MWSFRNIFTAWLAERQLPFFLSIGMDDDKEKAPKFSNNITWTIELRWCKWELPYQHFANCIFLPEKFFNAFIISTFSSNDMSYVTKIVYIANILISKPDSSWQRTIICFGRTNMHIVFKADVSNIILGPAYEWHTVPPRVSEEQTLWKPLFECYGLTLWSVSVEASNTISSA